MAEWLRIRFKKKENHIYPIRSKTTKTNWGHCRFFLINEFYTLLLFCRYLQGKLSDEVHSLLIPVQIFRVRTCNATFTGSNHLHPPISSVKTIAIPLRHYGTDSCVDASINATILTTLSQGSGVIYSFILLGVVSSLASVLHISTRHQRLCEWRKIFFFARFRAFQLIRQNLIATCLLCSFPTKKSHSCSNLNLSSRLFLFYICWKLKIKIRINILSYSCMYTYFIDTQYFILKFK